MPSKVPNFKSWGDVAELKEIAFSNTMLLWVKSELLYNNAITYFINKKWSKVSKRWL